MSEVATQSWPPPGAKLGSVPSSASCDEACSQGLDSGYPLAFPNNPSAQAAINSLPILMRELLEGGHAVEARRLIEAAITASADGEKNWGCLRDVGEWPDRWLVAAIRRDPPDEPALDELAQRYWKPLFGRCRMLALVQHDASDLAQEAWCRVLKSRGNLKPEANFPGYLYTIAMNLWRDRCRAERRAGAMAGGRLASLDAELCDQDGGVVTLGEAVPDLFALEAEQQALLLRDVDQALEGLAPLLRGVLVARFLSGESCAEIGRRHGRTEQTVSGWIRQGIQEVKNNLREPHVCAAPENNR